MSTYEIAVIDSSDGSTCFTATVTPAPWTARDAQELATDLARCLKSGHVVTAVAASGRDEGRAET
ncbi:hypothetical protein [Dactylosporangium sp. CA-139066]|uniref:hypothetical protein n=1 Tax=Dactylosporangium sp. CA-139066 TaxID=3239930 RepID=UPI003D93C36E